MAKDYEHDKLNGSGRGKKINQKLKPYLVLQYLMKYSDEEHPLSAPNIVEYLKESCCIYSEKLTLQEIAANANLSVRETQHCFQRIFHQSPNEYLISYRLNHAKKMLLETNDSITEIAFHCGFSDAS